MTTDVASNLELVRERIERACDAAARGPEEVTLIAVSKRQDQALIQQAIEAGQVDFGENLVQAMLQRIEALGHEGIRWHLIGNLQSNKGKQAIAADFVHGIGSLKAASALARAQQAQDETISRPIFLQVNISREASKSGLPSDAVEAALLQIQALPCLHVRGLMCIPDPNANRQGFADLRELRNEMRSATGMALPDLSMGMSSDYEDAIAEGATMVRVGRAIFGERSA